MEQTQSGSNGPDRLSSGNNLLSQEIPRAPSLLLAPEMWQAIFQRSADGLLLFVRPFETALLFEALFDFRGLAFCFASYCSIRPASFRSAVRNCSNCFISKSIFLKLSRRARGVPRKNSSWIRRRQSDSVNMHGPLILSASA